MNFLPEDIERYIEEHTRVEPELLQQLHRETWQKIVNPRMLSGHVQGRALSMFSKMIRPKTILEIGTFTGYSALCLAEGLADDGLLFTIDVNDELKWIQDKYFALSPYGARIHRHFGNALDVIPSLHHDFDVVFMDADKSNYMQYYDMIMARLKPGAFILIDNVLWSGKITSPAQTNDEDTRVLQALNDRVNTDERVENVLLSIRDGLMVLRVK